MIVVPGIGILSTQAVQVRSSSLRAPEKWMVEDKLAGFGVLPITFRFRTEWPDHLRMAADAAFADVNIPTHYFQWGVGFHAGNGWDILFYEVHRNDLNKATDENRYKCKC